MDGPGHLDERHGVPGDARRARRQLGQPRPAVAAEVLQDHVRAGPGPDRGVDLVAVAEAVDETRLEGLAGEQRRPVDQALAPRPGRGSGLAAMAATSCSITDCTTRSVASRWAAVNPRSVKTLPAFLYSWRWAIWGDPGLVEHAPQERHLGGDAGEAQITRRLEPDLLEARRQEVRDAAVAELPEGLAQATVSLPWVAEVADRVLQLLGLCQAQRRPRPAQLDHQARTLASRAARRSPRRTVRSDERRRARRAPIGSCGVSSTRAR